MGGTLNLQMHYDAMGDITARSDVAGGATWTYDSTRKHGVTQAGSSAFTYAYDANGNVSSRNGSIIGWTSYNYPSGVTTSAESASFDYGPDRQRWRMIYSGAAGVETTYYATPMFEAVYTSGGTDFRHYIYAGGRPVVAISRTTAGAINVRSLLADRQGGISSIVTDSTGASLVSESFSAFGNPREASTWSGAPTGAELTAMNGVTRQGYTFQTVLGSMGLNHMNGRVEDAITGRFLSPDPRTPNRYNTQSWNRYSYVNNNPLTYVDPTGFDEDLPYHPSSEGGDDGGDTGVVAGEGGVVDRGDPPASTADTKQPDSNNSAAQSQEAESTPSAPAPTAGNLTPAQQQAVNSANTPFVNAYFFNGELTTVVVSTDANGSVTDISYFNASTGQPSTVAFGFSPNPEAVANQNLGSFLAANPTIAGTTWVNPYTSPPH